MKAPLPHSWLTMPGSESRHSRTFRPGRRRAPIPWPEPGTSENEVLKWCGAGQASSAIVRRLAISGTTAETHIERACRKLDCINRIDTAAHCRSAPSSRPDRHANQSRRITFHVVCWSARGRCRSGPGEGNFLRLQARVGRRIARNPGRRGLQVGGSGDRSDGEAPNKQNERVLVEIMLLVVSNSRSFAAAEAGVIAHRSLKSWNFCRISHDPRSSPHGVADFLLAAEHLESVSVSADGAQKLTVSSPSVAKR